jgi:MFS superfamily sulfate permease-like transporter
MRRRDLVAGLSVAGLMLPEAVAYAGIAGLSPQRAIAAAIAGCLVYAVAGRSRFAIVSPTSSSAAILAATLALMPGDAAVKAGLATLTVAFVGMLFIAASVAGLGGLTGFISRPVLRGFAFGLAITIIVRQLPVIVGVPVAAPDLLHLLIGLANAFPDWHGASVAVGLSALVILLGLRRFPFIPGALIVLASGIAASVMLHLAARGVAVMGTVDLSLSWPALPALAWGQVSELAQYTLPLILILFAESWGTIRSLALRHGDPINPDRELRALGAANLASALVQGMPVGAGFSAGSASEAAGATSRWAAVAAASGLAALILLASPMIAKLPQPVLAAVVIAALTHALDPKPLARLWRIGRDQYIAIGAAIAVLALGVLNGMLVAIALSLAAMMRRLATPYLTQLARLGAHDFVDLARHPDAILSPGVAIWRPAEPLFFANADAIFGAVARRARSAPQSDAIVLSLEESFDLDSTALDALIEFDDAMSKAGILLHLARVHDHVRDLLGVAGADELLARCSYSVDDAVSALGSIGMGAPGASSAGSRSRPRCARTPNMRK